MGRGGQSKKEKQHEKKKEKKAKTATFSTSNNFSCNSLIENDTSFLADIVQTPQKKKQTNKHVHPPNVQWLR